MIVPRFDLAVTAPQLAAAVQRIVQGRGTGQPATLRAFEREFSEWLGEGMSSVFVPSARSGLFLILDGLRRLGRFEPSRRLVLLPAWTHASVPAVVRAAGFTPWFVDCNPHTLNADVHSVPSEVWAHASAAVVTHLYGTPADTFEWLMGADAHGVAVIEDCAQGLGARDSSGARCGTQGVASYFSFQLTKNFTTLGGGMVSTRDPALASLLREGVSEAPSPADRALAMQAIKGIAFRVATRPSIFALTVYPALRAGWKVSGRDLLHDAFEEKIEFTAPSGPLRAPAGVQAELGRAQLPLLDAANARRTEIGKRLHELLGGTRGLRLPAWPDGSQPIFMSFVLRVRKRMAFMRELLRRGVDTSPGYLRACHRLPSRANDGRFGGVTQVDCPHALRLESEQVHLPVYPRLSDREVEFVARAVHAAAETVLADEVPEAEAITIGQW